MNNLDANTIELLEDAAKRRGVSFDTFVQSETHSLYTQLAAVEFAKQACEDAATEQ